ncbi:MAG: large conductance mechanosensitive channel protein MscL [Solobacterium sp.]|jgi:large conductance mechanosensitive channel|nr:large conductance mechanosensitive channel protein MscL [Solobacterium sp.]MCH4205010.1 large conductance mechanosensitive channel protein MscL [Solobacterium sp.]MCH4226519.1 large conductance mechanosensitive channel protein MscL [Solobacterium sp.]MCH4281803.1 large conductance mechanosensitive channel protein MscL [Solobacterium sp.]
MKKFMQEFKEFALKGNVMDMAVGVIIGAAFKTIIDSLVSDIINPLIGIAFKTDFSAVVITLPGNVALNIGNFISTVINFILMALVLFLIVKAVNRLDSFGKKEEPVKEEPKKSDELLALEEIAALLKEKKD